MSRLIALERFAKHWNVTPTSLHRSGWLNQIQARHLPVFVSISISISVSIPIPSVVAARRVRLFDLLVSGVRFIVQLKPVPTALLIEFLRRPLSMSPISPIEPIITAIVRIIVHIDIGVVIIGLEAAAISASFRDYAAGRK